jgi:hypothetical protein
LLFAEKLIYSFITPPFQAKAKAGEEITIPVILSKSRPVLRFENRFKI